MKAIRVALLAALLISCSDTDQVSLPTQAVVSTSNLTFLRLSGDAFAAAEKSGSFWAVPGQASSLVLRYSDTGEEFLRFDVGASSLETTEPVQISVQLDPTGALIFHFAPSGTQFNNSDPAILRINYARMNPDVDGDGDADLSDRILGTQAGIWKRELPLLPWLKMPSIRLQSDVEQAKIYDFTSFGMAVD